MAEAASAQDDLSASSAYATLDALLSEGKLTQAELQLYKSKFAKLHAAVLQTYDNEVPSLEPPRLACLRTHLTRSPGNLQHAPLRIYATALAANAAELTALHLRPHSARCLQRQSSSMPNWQRSAAIWTRCPARRRRAPRLQPRCVPRSPKGRPSLRSGRNGWG